MLKSLFIFLVASAYPCVLFSQDLALREHQDYTKFSFQQNHLFLNPQAKIPGETMKKVGTGLAIGGAGLTLIGILLMSSADELYYTQTIGPNGEVVEEGDIKGALGLVTTITGVGMGITGIVLWSKGNKKYKRHMERQGAYLNVSPRKVALRYSF